MRKMLITGGTGFVSGFFARYFVCKRWQVWVLNQGSKTQMPDVNHIEADRHTIGDRLRGLRFDAVLDVIAYDAADVESLLGALEGEPDYVLISSSSIYPETLPQPFTEEMPVGENRIWGDYGMGKVRAEAAARRLRPDCYILRPPYLYGAMQNLYREPFIFDCAFRGLPFYLPGDGSMPLHFNNVEDLARFVSILLDEKPGQRIYNTGNPDTITVRDWVEMCYDIVGTPCKLISVGEEHPQRSYFPFHPYAYQLDVGRQLSVMPKTTPLTEGFWHSWNWYRTHPDGVMKRDYLGYIRDRIEKG